MWVSVAGGAGRGGAEGSLKEGRSCYLPSADPHPPIPGSTLRDETLIVEAGSPRPGEHASICLWNFGGG